MPELQLSLLPQGKTALLALKEPENQEPIIYLSFREKSFSLRSSFCDPELEAFLPLKTKGEAQS